MGHFSLFIYPFWHALHLWTWPWLPVHTFTLHIYVIVPMYSWEMFLSFYINSKALAIRGNYKCQKPLTLLTRFECGGELFVAIFIGRWYSWFCGKSLLTYWSPLALKKGKRLFGPDRHFLRFLEDWALLYIWELIHRLCSTRWWTQRGGFFRREKLNITAKLLMV